MNQAFEMLSPKQVQALIGISERTFYRIKGKSGFPGGHLIGKRVYFNAKDIQDWIETRRVLPEDLEQKKSPVE